MQHVLMPYLEDDCTKVLTYIDEHPVSSVFYRLPNWVTSLSRDDNGNVSTIKLSMPELLYLLVKAIAGGTDNVLPVNSAPSPFEDTGKFLGEITKTEYMKVAKSVKDFIKNQKRAPNYVTATVTYDSQQVTKKISTTSITLLFINIVNELDQTQTYPGSMSIMRCV